MSYILEALKKSQQEREAVVTDQAVQFTQPISTETRSKTGVAVVLLLVSILLLGFLLYVVMQKTPTYPVPAIEVKPVEVVIETPVMQERIISPREIMAAASVIEEKIETDSLVKSEQQVVVDDNTKPLRVEERRLPPLDSLRKIPALIINSHIYSGLSDKRSVTINNKTQREGDYLTSTIFIKEITAKGIIIDVDGWPLSISRQQGWQPIPEGN